MAVTENSYTGNGSTTNYSFTFPYLKSTDVQVQVDATVTTAWQFANATTVQFNTAPSNGAKIKILRDTNVDSLAATFYAGSSIKSEDLNDNYTQNLYKTQEVGNRYFSTTGGTMTGDLTLGEDVTLTFEGATDNANETKLTVVDPTADRTITFPDTTGTVVTTGDTGTVAHAMLAGDAVDGDNIANDSINSEHYVDGSIDTQHIADSQITTAKIADNNVTTAKIVDANITTAKLAADSVNGTKIADDSINSEHYVDGSIDTQHIADNQITTAKIVNDAVTADKLANTSVTAGTYSAADITVDAQGRVTAASSGAIATSEITDGAVSTAKLAADSVTNAKIADGVVDTDKLTNSSVTYPKIANEAVITSKIANSAVTDSKIASNAVTTAKIADNAITTAKILDGAIATAKIAENAVLGSKITNNTIAAGKLQSNSVTTDKIANTNVTDAKLASNSVTTSKITDANVTTDKIADNAITIGKIGCEQTVMSNSHSFIPTSGAVVDFVASQIQPLGGLEVVATEVAFPNTQPSSGVVISISDAGGVVVNGSGVSTTGRTVGGSTVTINGFPSSLQSSTLAAGIGLLVSSTGSSQTYNYHKILGKEDDIKQLSDDINDFQSRYRVSGSAPTSSLDNGDLWFDTTNGKMMVYNSTNTAWEEVSAIGSFNINTLSSSGNTGGGSATFNGSAYRFTLSNPPQDAQQLLVSINGVIQKPNTGSSQPSEGFAVSGNDIIFSAAPASGSTSFIITLGQAVQIGTPSDGSVSTAKLASGAVTTAKIADDAVTGDKIATSLDLPDNNKIRFGTGNDFQIFHDGTNTMIDNDTGDLKISSTGTLRLRGDNVAVQNNNQTETMGYFATNGAAKLYYDNAEKIETVSGGVIVNGSIVIGTVTLDGGGLSIQDPDKIKCGNGDDLQIYHDGTNSYITNSADGGVLYLQTYGENSLKAHPNGQVELFYDASKKFETTSSGIAVTGTVEPTGHIKLGDNSFVYFGAGVSTDLYID